MNAVIGLLIFTALVAIWMLLISEITRTLLAYVRARRIEKLYARHYGNTKVDLLDD